MIAGKSDLFCAMKCRSDSERITGALERRLIVLEIHVFYSAHNQTQLFCESHELGLFSLKPILIS